jgi:hypothetical protein
VTARNATLGSGMLFNQEVCRRSNRMKGVLIVHGSFSIFYHLFKHRTPVDWVKWFQDRADRDRFCEEAQILDAKFKMEDHFFFTNVRGLDRASH